MRLPFTIRASLICLLVGFSHQTDQLHALGQGLDAAAETRTDSSADSGADSDVDSNTESSTDSGTDSGADSGAEVGPYDPSWRRQGDRSQARLIFASDALTNEDGRLAALEIQLSPDWKTYWRSPGEAGLPPQISLNGKPLDILFPLPKPIIFYGIRTYGYADRVVFPFRLPPGADMAGEIAAFFMVCRDICVPEDEIFTGSAPSNATAAVDISLAQWLNRVPEKDAGFTVANAKIAGRIDHQRLILDGRLPMGATTDLLIVEADGFVMGGVETRRLSEPDMHRFIIPMKPQIKGTDLSSTAPVATLAVKDGPAWEFFIPINGIKG